MKNGSPTRRTRGRCTYLERDGTTVESSDFGFPREDMGRRSGTVPENSRPRKQVEEDKSGGDRLSSSGSVVGGDESVSESGTGETRQGGLFVFG